jgi:hypothetical protein
VGSVEEHSSTRILARAMHRGQYSMVSHAALTLMLRPHREQLKQRFADAAGFRMSVTLDHETHRANP